jgi:hypothetical protein
MELGVAINRLADSVASSHGFVALLDNPFYMAIMLTIIIMIILFFAGFRPSAKSAGAAHYIRPAFYVSCAIIAVVFIYHRRFQMCQSRTARIETIGAALASPATMGNTDGVPVITPVFM